MYSPRAFINSKWCQLSDTNSLFEHRNPADLSAILYPVSDDLGLAEEAVEKAHHAFESWKNTTLAERANFLKKLSTQFEKREDEIAQCITKEVGKASWEAKIEAKALKAKIELNLNQFLKFLETFEALGKTNSAYFKFKPRGVCVALGPFNFPLHLANGHIVPALLAGNSIIFKPSEYCFESADLYAQCMEAAGFPAGVFQMLPGAAKTGTALVENSKVRGVFFTGSYENGRRITHSLLETRSHLQDIAALEMGGKNALIIHKDADFEKAIGGVMMSAYASAGQRCTCASRLFVHESLVDRCIQSIQSKLSSIQPAAPEKSDTFMGPLVHQQALQNFLAKLKAARLQGFEVLVDSEPLDPNTCLVSPSLYLSTQPEQQTQTSSLKEEFFGPNTIVIPYSTQEQLFEWHERADFGLALSVYSQSKEFFEEVDRNTSTGLLNWNKPTVGASGSLPFGGTKKSGNNWPAGMFSYFYCAQPKSYLIDQTGFSKEELPKNLQRAWEAQ